MMRGKAERIKILFFIGTLRAGGKERRLIELMTYLVHRGVYDLEIVFTSNEIHFPEFYDLGIPFKIIQKKFKKNDPSVIFQFYRICSKTKPDLIHSWGRVQSMYTLPSVIGQGIPLLNSQITSAPPKVHRWSFRNILNQFIFSYSTFILANSKAGLKAFHPPKSKSRLIYNGINLCRFEGLPDNLIIKEKYQIKTPYTIVMVASVSPKKDYELFFRIAMHILKSRNDISFVGAGLYFEDDPFFLKIKNLISDNPNIILTGRINEVEALVNACDIGVLFSPNGEGLSNTILEYMALGKPVVANNTGGNKEIILHNENGYLLDDPKVEETAELMLELIDNKDKREKFGEVSMRIIKERFTIDLMGSAFEEVYYQIKTRTLNKYIHLDPVNEA